MYCKTACTTCLFPTGKAFFFLLKSFRNFRNLKKRVSEKHKCVFRFSGFTVTSILKVKLNKVNKQNRLARMIRSVDINNIFIKITSNGKSDRVKGGVIRSSRVKRLFKFLILIFKSRSFLVTRHCCKKY